MILLQPVLTEVGRAKKGAAPVTHKQARPHSQQQEEGDLPVTRHNSKRGSVRQRRGALELSHQAQTALSVALLMATMALLGAAVYYSTALGR